MSRIRDKCAIVTGGTRGIGSAIAKRLAHHGARVFICGRSKAFLRSALEEFESSYPAAVRGMTCDVRDSAQVREFVRMAEAELGGVDILVNNAGVGFFRPVEQMAIDEWNTTIETNLNGVFYFCHETIPCLKRRGGGYILNIGSLAGKNAFPGGGAYNASKFGLIGFSEALMQEVRYDHIRVSYIMPGSVNTKFAGHEEIGQSESWKLSPEDVAQVVVDLLEMDPRALPSRVELRPSEPRK